MKKLICLCTLLMVFGFASAQEPFDVPTVDFPKVKVIDYTRNFGFIKTIERHEIDSSNLTTLTNPNLNFLLNTDEIRKTKNSIPSINVSFIKYRIGIFSYKAKKAVSKRNVSVGDTIRVYLPLVLLSRFTLDYDSMNYAALNDATSFSGSPFTFRLMPSYAWNVGLENTLTVGCVADFRSIVLRDTVSNETDWEFAFYFSAGIKYSGKGEVRDERGQAYSGKWSLSALFYGVNGNRQIEEDLYGGNAGQRGAEFIFKFKVLDTKLTKFNLLANAQYLFGDTGDGSPWIFKFGIGN